MTNKEKFLKLVSEDKSEDFLKLLKRNKRNKRIRKIIHWIKNLFK